MTRISSFALVALLMHVPMPAKADRTSSGATVADVRCVVVASVFANDPSHASSAALLTYYFLGRIDGRESASFNLAQAMLAQINLMSQDDFNAEGKRCGKELEERAVYMTEVGRRLTEQKK